MEKSQFFGEKGLTTTSANYIANLAKEAYEKLESKLNSTSFIEETITVIGSTAETKVSLSNKELLTSAPTILKEICEYKALIAWLREAIKEKDNLFKANQKYISDETHNHELNRPEREMYLTQEDVINSWSIKEREEYFHLETLCAVIGKYIHPNGALSQAKRNLSNKINHPVTTESSGRDTIIRRYYPTATEEEVNELFFSLQKNHREYQAKLNGIKHKIDVTLREDMLAKDEAYTEATKVYHEKLKELREVDNIFRTNRHKEIEALKIVIPNNLKEVYDKLASM